MAAVIKNLESQYGRPLTNAEKQYVKNSTNCIVYHTCTHRDFSRTYGGRNAKEQIEMDAKDLTVAQEKDLLKIKSTLVSKGYQEDKIDKAFNKLRELNKNNGLTK